MQKRNLSIPEYCQVYGYGRSVAYEDMKSGDLKYIKVKNRTLIPTEFAEELQRKRMAAASENEAA